MRDLITKEDQKVYDQLLQECYDSWQKKQVYRTETEMRLSVLNDAKHPTPAAKYWQSVREQSVFFEQLMFLQFEYRRNQVKRKQLSKEIENESDTLKKESLQIDLEQLDWIIKSQKLDAHHRIRELEHWSRIKEELNDGSFNIKDPNDHQMVSLPKRFEHDYKSITPGASVGEVRNAVGLYQTALRHKALKQGKPIKELTNEYTTNN